jgi:hypothetical protein
MKRMFFFVMVAIVAVVLLAFPNGAGARPFASPIELPPFVSPLATPDQVSTLSSADSTPIATGGTETPPGAVVSVRQAVSWNVGWIRSPVVWWWK